MSGTFIFHHRSETIMNLQFFRDFRPFFHWFSRYLFSQWTRNICCYCCLKLLPILPSEFWSDLVQIWITVISACWKDKLATGNREVFNNNKKKNTSNNFFKVLFKAVIWNKVIAISYKQKIEIIQKKSARINIQQRLCPQEGGFAGKWQKNKDCTLWREAQQIDVSLGSHLVLFFGW